MVAYPKVHGAKPCCLASFGDNDWVYLAAFRTSCVSSKNQIFATTSLSHLDHRKETFDVGQSVLPRQEAAYSRHCDANHPFQTCGVVANQPPQGYTLLCQMSQAATANNDVAGEAKYNFVASQHLANVTVAIPSCLKDEMWELQSQIAAVATAIDF